MRVAEARGELARVFDEGWKPELLPLLEAVLAENRRWLPHHTKDVLKVVKLTDGKASEDAVRISGGLRHEEMLGIAEAAGMRSTLMTIADECVALYERVIDLVPEWKALPKVQVEPWSRLGVR
jgi:hypothetical protein